MADHNGEVKLNELFLDDDSVGKSEDYPKLTEYGLDLKVASKLDEIYRSGKVAHADLDERALDALKELPVEGAIYVLKQFFQSNLEYVSNKSAYLCGVMKTYWQNSKGGGTTGPGSSDTAPASTPAEGADEDNIKLDNHEIQPDQNLKVRSIPNQRLFVGNVPKWKGKQEIMYEFSKFTAGLTEVIIYSSPDDKNKNRGFCFLEYESHEAAFVAKQRLETGQVKLWGFDIIVDWADPLEEPDSETMAAVKVLYVRNLTQEFSEKKLKEAFEVFGKVNRARKIKNYAFIHFNERDHAVNAMNDLNGKSIGGSCIEVSLAKPPYDKKKKQEILTARERHTMKLKQFRAGGFSSQHPNMIGPLPRDYGYGDYRGGYSDPYHDDYYSYKDCYHNYTSPVPPAQEMTMPAQTGGCERGTVGCGLQVRSVEAPEVSSSSSSSNNRFQEPELWRAQVQGAPHRGHPHNYQPARGSQRANQSLPGKRKLDGGHQNQEKSKRRYQCSWGNQPLAQQPLGNTFGINGGASSTGDQQWYQNS